MLRIAITTFLLSAGAASAHPGHEAAFTHGDAHWLLQADHLAVLIPAALAGGILLRRYWRLYRESGRRLQGRKS